MRTKDGVSSKSLTLIAAGIAFYAFMAIPSTFTALVSLYGLIFDPADVGRQISAMQGVLPGEAIAVLTQQLQDLASHSTAALGVGFIISLAVALWSARSATSSIVTALNIAYGERESRGWLAFQLAALGLTAGGVLFALLSLALIGVLPAVIDLLPLGSAGKTLASILRWPLLIVLVISGLAALYRFGPCRAQARWRWVSWGAAAATALWIGGSVLFSVYVGEFASYDKTYGSLGAVVVLLMWLYLTAVAVLLGAEVNAELEHQTARDSTTGAPKPMGMRGAKMADTLGEER